MEHNEKESAEVEEKRSPAEVDAKGRERRGGGIGPVGTIGYSKRERKRDVFLPKGTFYAGSARSSLLGEAARTRRAAPRRRRNRPRVSAGRFSGGKRVVGYPARESAWSTVVGLTGRGPIGVEKSGDPCVWDARKDGGSDGGAISLGGGGEGRQLRSAGWTTGRGGGRFGSRGRVAGRDGTGRRGGGERG